MRLFGLIGNPITHSFSQRYFSEKFVDEGIRDARYELFPMESLDLFPQFLDSHSDLVGLNVTIPYKETIHRYLNAIDLSASVIGAVNVIKKQKNGDWKGYNTDYSGFLASMLLLGDQAFWKDKTALVFGTGGGSKAVQSVLQALQISYEVVSRSDTSTYLMYESLTRHHIERANVLINATPVGMWPQVLDELPIPYEGFHDKHLVLDLIYNPTQTSFLKKAAAKGARTLNGYHMLVNQAEKAWEIWNTAD